MPRITAIDPATAQGMRRELLDGVKAKAGMLPNLVKTMAQSPATLEAYVGLSGAVAGGSLTAQEREQIALVTAELNGCGYCLAAHSKIGAAVGLSAGEVMDARRGNAATRRGDAILALARELIGKRGRVDDATIARARDAGLSDGELTEVVANVALNTFTNYLNELAETDVDFPQVTPLEARTA